jgi:hypothetical protein
MKLILKILLVLLLLFYFCNSFKRYTWFSLDGDLAPIVLPAPSYEAVLHDPFGLNVLLHDAVYPATNRFFTHFFLSIYFKLVPLVLQYLFSPIDSVYISCAIIKVLIHFLLIFTISSYITNKKKLWDINVLLTFAVLAPLFLVYGYYDSMAIIDSSITYTFFYALSMLLILLFFQPFFNAAMGRSSFVINKYKIVSLIFLLIIISFSGALNGPVVILICSLSLTIFFVKNYLQSSNILFYSRIRLSIKNIPSSLYYLFVFAIIAGVYSYYIGTFNSENFWNIVPLSERYSKLWNGLVVHFTEKLGPGLLVSVVIFNLLIIWKSNPNEEAKKIIQLFKWFSLFFIIYILLLPIGGYRVYRPVILRYDTMMPINLAFIFFYGYSSWYLIKTLTERLKLVFYCLMISGISLIYINADFNFEVRKYNSCERESFEKIAKSPQREVFIDADCTIFDWDILRNKRDSRYKSAMLLHWNIIKEQKLYYQK